MFMCIAFSVQELIRILHYRLWHQITLKLLEFFDHPLSKPYRVDVFDKFVRDFEGKLNQLRLVEMAVKVSKEIDSAFYPAVSVKQDSHSSFSRHFPIILFCRSKTPPNILH